MGQFKPMPSAEYQQLCGRAMRKVTSMATVAATLGPTDTTVLVEESILNAITTLASWGEA